MEILNTIKKIKWVLYITLGIITLLLGYFMFYSIIKYSEAKRDKTVKPDILRYMSRSMILFILLFLLFTGFMAFSIYTIQISIPRSIKNIEQNIEKGVESILKALSAVGQPLK